MLVGKPIVLADMEAVDTEFYNSIKYILDNDPEPLCLNFLASREFLGQVTYARTHTHTHTHDTHTHTHTCMCTHTHTHTHTHIHTHLSITLA